MLGKTLYNNCSILYIVFAQFSIAIMILYIKRNTVLNPCIELIIWITWTAFPLPAAKFCFTFNSSRAIFDDQKRDTVK